MSGTPRLRSAFPSTPQSTKTSYAGQNGPQGSSSRFTSTLRDVAELARSSQSSGPLISTEVVDTPTQRLYIFAAYIGLLAWRLYDVYLVDADDAQSLWLFMKWVALDGVFLFGLPALRIPWLEWSPIFTTVLFIVHSLVDGLLMFRVQLPFSAILVALSKTLYDRELAITEKRVKPANVLHNPSLILGKQVIHVLPEGSATLNPDRSCFCLDEIETSVLLPIEIKQSKPVRIELLRTDIDTTQNETSVISGSQMKKLWKEASKTAKPTSSDAPLLLKYPVRKTGIYQLLKVVDESKMEVQRPSSEVAVVACPSANIKETGQHKCKGALSDLVIEVSGVPPLKMKYRKLSDGAEREASLQGIQPDDYNFALTRSSFTQGNLANGHVDTSLTQKKMVPVPIDEALLTSGSWTYVVEEVQDAFGNKVSYADAKEEGHKHRRRNLVLQQSFEVHERLRASIIGCSPNKPLKVAKGQNVVLPLRFDQSLDESRTVDYIFTPKDKLSGGGEHSPDASVLRRQLKNANDNVVISEAGLYTLRALKTQYCDGDILEPASCLLQHPPQPELTLKTEEIFDKCAGNPIGLRATLDLIGSPPYDVQYTVQRKDEKQYRIEHVKLNGAREQIELTPPAAGHYVYTFTEVSDAVYKSLDLRSRNLVIEQDVKPSATAHFTGTKSRIACVDSTASFDVTLYGEGPFTLEYELVHNGKRSKTKIEDIVTDHYNIITQNLNSGGEHTLALTSITDRMGCTEFLKETATVHVRHQRPKAAFGQVEGRRSVRNLEGQKAYLPLRLTGEPPWRLSYRNIEAAETQPTQLAISSANDFVEVASEGSYELLSVQDAVCPGFIDVDAKTFEVNWIPRPSIKISETPTVRGVGGKWRKDDVCEGEDSLLELSISGTPPFELKYEEHFKSEQGQKSLRRKDTSAALHLATVRTDTSQAGTYEYRFTKLEDHHYTHNPKTYSPIVVEQRVHPLPSAQFTSPGLTYSYCAHKEDDSEEVIPIKLTGVPPFDLEIELKHQGAARPEIIDVPKVQTTTHDLRIPSRLLQIGHSSVSIRRVRDSRGCTRSPSTDNSHSVTTTSRVQVSVHEPPTITPLESHTDFCVGDRLSFALAGTGPFTVLYTFEGVPRRAASTPSTTFRRLAEQPGEFVITGVQDSASHCTANVDIRKTIHPMPSVRLSQGRNAVTDIPVGGATDLVFEFGGTPPFEFTYTRSANPSAVRADAGAGAGAGAGSGGIMGGLGKNSKKPKRGGLPDLLETRSERSEEHTMRIPASEEGTYEVVAIKDRYCAFARDDPEGYRKKSGGMGQKLLHL